MARILSQTLIRDTCTFLCKPSSHPFPCHSSRLVNSRHRSNSSRGDRANKARLIEFDLESSEDVEVFGLKRLEDMIHGIIIRRSAPAWLPFVPGSSYWVPPKKTVVELVGGLENPLTEEETLALTTFRGWPSSSYFVEGASPHSGDANSKTAAQSEDEEG